MRCIFRTRLFHPPSRYNQYYSELLPSTPLPFALFYQNLHMSSSPSPKPKNKALEDTSRSRVRKFINDEASEDNDIDVDENLTSEEDTISSKDLLAVSDDDEMPFALALLAENARKAKRAVVSDDSDDDVEVVDQSDSAFNNTYGIKASTLGPPIGTRSSYKRKSAPVGAPSGKRVRLLATDNLS
ncbi:hypothetical protein C8J57DRAFT_135024 [Mycena rebaudengoi]|nr:hypothetical protein C8J57DRAFT_135024 [Mycena rebaudengoi]